MNSNRVRSIIKHLTVGRKFAEYETLNESCSSYFLHRTFRRDKIRPYIEQVEKTEKFIQDQMAPASLIGSVPQRENMELKKSIDITPAKLVN